MTKGGNQNTQRKPIQAYRRTCKLYLFNPGIKPSYFEVTLLITMSPPCSIRQWCSLDSRQTAENILLRRVKLVILVSIKKKKQNKTLRLLGYYIGYLYIHIAICLAENILIKQKSPKPREHRASTKLLISIDIFLKHPNVNFLPMFIVQRTSNFSVAVHCPSLCFVDQFRSLQLQKMPSLKIPAQTVQLPKHRYSWSI